MDLNEIRPEIIEFAIAMENKMRSKDAEKGDSWKRIAIDYLKLGMQSEYGEAVNSTDPIEYVDIANFCMMLFHRYKYNPTTGGEIHGRK